MKFSKKNCWHIFVLYSLYLLLVLGMCRAKFAYGSTLDWSSQHYAIPDYFRKLFYETGDLFPSLALNMGAGENIYDLSYYGLFSPIIMFSYLLPFVKMSTYIQAVSIIGILVSVFIFYKWMLKKFSADTAFLLTFVFMFSTSFIFHSHRHIMFVNYMPFLLLSFMAVDDYFAGRKKYKLIVFPFLMIMTSYFFAVSGMVAVAVYGVYVYLKSVDNFKVKEFAKEAVFFISRLIISVLMSGVLILPTVYCMLSGRDGGNVNIDWKIFLPSVNMRYILYHNYSMGMSLFAVVSIISAVIAKDKHRKFLGIVIGAFVTFPVFVYALNGTLYTDPKVLIPFMPLCVILIGQTFNDIVSERFRYKPVLTVTAVYTVIGLVFFNNVEKILYTAIPDLITLLLFMFLYYKKKTVQFVYLAAAGCLAISSILGNFDDNIMKLYNVEANDGEDVNELASIAADDDDMVRTGNLFNVNHTANMIYNMDFYSANIYSSLHNKKYNNFYFNHLYNENEFRNTAMTTQPQSIINQIYMSEKYLIVENGKSVPTGNKFVCSNGTLSLYKNENVLPFGYVSSQIMNVKDYENLEYPYSLEALLDCSVSESMETSVKNYKSTIKEIKPFELNQSFYITKKGKKYTVESDANMHQAVKLSQPLKKDEILLISMTVDNNLPGEKNDARVTINGIRNTLTNPNWKYYNGNTQFEFALTTKNKNSLDKLKITLSSGHYTINNIKCYIMKYPDLSKMVDKFEVNKNETKGDVISGSVNASQDGFFNLSVPYSDGFEVFVDGQKVEYEMADNAFIGFKISAGKHDIRITFTSPLRKQGMYMSAAGFILFVISLCWDLFRKYHKAKEQKL